MRLYLDAAPVIYVVEHIMPYAAVVDAALSMPDVQGIISDLTRMECRLKPLREKNLDLLADFDDFFRLALAEVVPLTAQVIDRATVIRATFGFDTPDAIHLAAALVYECDALLTNDNRLASFSDIEIRLVGQ